MDSTGSEQVSVAGSYEYVNKNFVSTKSMIFLACLSKSWFLKKFPSVELMCQSKCPRLCSDAIPGDTNILNYLDVRVEV